MQLFLKPRFFEVRLKALSKPLTKFYKPRAFKAEVYSTEKLASPSVRLQVIMILIYILQKQAT